MIEVSDTYGKKIFLAQDAVSEVLEAAASSQWHGTKSYIRTFDGRTIGVRESASEIAEMLNAKESKR